MEGIRGVRVQKKNSSQTTKIINFMCLENCDKCHSRLAKSEYIKKVECTFDGYMEEISSPRLMQEVFFISKGKKETFL